jgi:ribosomal protein L35AE/L33A
VAVRETNYISIVKDIIKCAENVDSANKNSIYLRRETVWRRNITGHNLMKE